MISSAEERTEEIVCSFRYPHDFGHLRTEISLIETVQKRRQLFSTALKTMGQLWASPAECDRTEIGEKCSGEKQVIKRRWKSNVQFGIELCPGIQLCPDDRLKNLESNERFHLYSRWWAHFVNRKSYISQQVSLSCAVFKNSSFCAKMLAKSPLRKCAWMHEFARQRLLSIPLLYRAYPKYNFLNQYRNLKWSKTWLDPVCGIFRRYVTFMHLWKCCVILCL
jgi:hypothetical protein